MYREENEIENNIINNKIKWKLTNFCECDSYASKSYCAIHNVSENLNLGDITMINEKEISDFNMIVGGSPCQDFSISGKQKGIAWTCKDCEYVYNPLAVYYERREKCPRCSSVNIEKSRSSLLMEWLRILRKKKPSFGIYENVKNIVGKQFKSTFELFISELNEYGYNTYWQVLNAKNYGIPQNRERIYLIIIKKEIDNGKFKFPQGFNTRIRLKDLLEVKVSHKYYINNQRCSKLLAELKQKGVVENSENKVQQIGNIVDKGKWSNPQRGRIYSSLGCSPTLNCVGGGGLEPKILETMTNNNQHTYQVRKLTPKECFLLMGFSNDDFKKAKCEGISNSQLYKQAGNSVVVDVLFYIMFELYNAMPSLFVDIQIGSFFSGIGAFEKALAKLEDYINK